MARKRSKNSEAPGRRGESSQRFGRYCFIILMGGAVLLAWLSMLTFSKTDPPANMQVPRQPAANFAGVVGAYVAYGLRYWLGLGAYMLLLFLSVASVIMMAGGKVRDLPWRAVGLVLLVTGSSCACYLLDQQQAHNDPGVGSAGVLGIAVGGLLAERLSAAAWVIVGVSVGIGMMLTADNLMLRLPHWGRAAWRKRSEIPSVINLLRPVGAAISVATAPKREQQPATAAPKPKRLEEPRDERDNRPRVSIMAPPPVPSAPRDSAAANEADAPAPKPDAADKSDKPPKNTLPVLASAAPKAPIAPAAARRPDKPEKEPAAEPRKFELPPSDLLVEPAGGYLATQCAAAEQKRAVLQQTLDDFAVEAQVVAHQTGPVITLFELSLSPGVKVAQVQSLANDIARALAVPGVRIFSPVPGKDTVGVEVPNMQKEMVRIKELMQLAPDAEKKMHLPLYLGKDAGGSAIVADLSRMPHMLIAGTTGSGKSVCINTIIMSLLLTRTPDQCRFILIDPKMVEMAAFESIPHLLCPVVNDMRRAEEILAWAATKMDERYELLKEAGVKNIAQFNQLKPEEIYQRFGVVEDAEKAQIPTRLQYYVIIVDELADLIMTSSKEVEGHIIRIAQKARAVGIHMILATQRPSVNVVTGLIKSNMPCRISFRVASRQESRIVLDQNGAEVLLGQGDMLLLQPGTSNLARAQGTLVDDAEIRTVVEALRKTGEPQYNSELMHLGEASVGEGGGERDPLFDQAVEIVLASQRGSVSLLQRRLQIGYSRSSRIIDQMAEAGIIGEFKGSQARECNMTLEDWQTLRASMERDQSGEAAVNGEPTSA
jgi:S-DNA-T family DNA segregation ATPase FtsK/SpoIIIE